MARKQKKLEDSKLVNKAIKEGVYRILRTHPGFVQDGNITGKRINDFAKHIDKRKLRNAANKLYEEAVKKELNYEDLGKYIYRGISNYVATAAVFNNRGIEAILTGRIEEKAKKRFTLAGILAGRRFKEERNLEKVLSAFDDLYVLAKENKIQDEMPEVARAAKTLKYFNFIYPTMKKFREKGIMDRKEYKEIVRAMNKRVTGEYNVFKQGLNAYISPQKAAAAIFLIFGIMLFILSELRITGAAIGVSDPLAGIFGILLVLISSVLFYKIFGK